MKHLRIISRWLYLGMGLLLLVKPLPGEDFFKVKEEIIQKAWKKKSIFYISPTLNFSNLGYRSNIYSYEYLESPDWTADIGLDLSLAVIVKDRFIFRVREFPSYSLYLENDRERAFNNIFQFTAYTWVGRFNVKYQFERPYVHDRIDPEIGWRLRRWETRHLLSVDYGNHRWFYLNVYFRQRTVSYKDELYLDSFNLNQLFGRTEYWLGASANKIIFSRTRLSFRFDYFDHRYRFIPWRDRTGGQFSFRVTFPAGSHLSGSLSYGVRFIRPVSSLHRDFVKPFGFGLLGIRVLERLGLRLVYQVDHRYSFAGADLYYDTRSIGGGGTFRFSRSLRLTYIYRLGRRTYQRLHRGGVTRKDDFTLSRLALILRRGEKTEIGLEYRAYRSDSTQLRFVRSYDYIGGYVKHDF